MANLSLGRYEVLARLSQGASASIFLARSRGAAGFNRLVALKILRPELAARPEIVTTFLDEARMAARLRHPNCVEIYDLGRTGDTYFISMEYLLGESLELLLPRQIFEPDEAAFIIASACDGLHHAHQLVDSRGRAFELVHRDISPKNLLITSDGYLKIVDFGIAKTAAHRELTATGEIKGEAGYMSPEQIAGREIDRRSDIFSLGIILWEALTGKRLFDGMSVEEVMQKVISAAAPRVRDLVPHAPRELDAICARALERQREKRFADAKEMAVAIRSYLDRAWPGHHPGEISQTLQGAAGEKIEAKKRGYEALVAGTAQLGRVIAMMGAEPARKSDFLMPVEENTVEDRKNDSSIATVIEVEVSQSGSDPDPTLVEPEAVSPAWMRVPSLGIHEPRAVIETTQPELDDDDEDTVHRDPPQVAPAPRVVAKEEAKPEPKFEDQTRELAPRTKPPVRLWIAYFPLILALGVFLIVLVYLYSGA